MIKEEIDKLLSVGLIKKVQYPTWLANAVLIKKANGKWRVCIDFTDLNKMCLKDYYPLSSINKLVDSTSGYVVVPFLDTISGYHQIMMDTENAEKSAFIMAEEVFCYMVMLFGLKNAGATYQKLVSTIFKDMVGATIKVCIIIRRTFRGYSESS